MLIHKDCAWNTALEEAFLTEGVCLAELKKPSENDDTTMFFFMLLEIKNCVIKA